MKEKSDEIEMSTEEARKLREERVKKLLSEAKQKVFDAGAELISLEHETKNPRYRTMRYILNPIEDILYEQYLKIIHVECPQCGFPEAESRSMNSVFCDLCEKEFSLGLVMETTPTGFKISKKV